MLILGTLCRSIKRHTNDVLLVMCSGRTRIVLRNASMAFFACRVAAQHADAILLLQLRHLNIDTMARVAHAAVVKPRPQDVSLYRFRYASASSRLLCSALRSPCSKYSWLVAVQMAAMVKSLSHLSHTCHAGIVCSF